MVNHALQNLLETAIFTEKPFSNAFAGNFKCGWKYDALYFYVKCIFCLFCMSYCKYKCLYDANYLCWPNSSVKPSASPCLLIGQISSISSLLILGINIITIVIIIIIVILRHKLQHAFYLPSNRNKRSDVEGHWAKCVQD